MYQNHGWGVALRFLCCSKEDIAFFKFKKHRSAYSYCQVLFLSLCVFSFSLQMLSGAVCALLTFHREAWSTRRAGWRLQGSLASGGAVRGL